MQKQRAEVGVLRRAAFLPDLRSLDEQARTIEFVSSTEKTDRYGDVIRVAGWQLDAYLKNPVFMWAHRSSEPPIGKCVEIHTESNPPALVQKIQFADAATYPFADTIFNLYRERMMNAVSVGFMPLEMPKRITDAEGNATGGYEFTSQELLELSAVPIPANPEAVARMVSKGFGSEADLRRVFAPQMSAEEVYRELISIHQEISSIALRVATAAVEKALAAIKAASVHPESDELTLEELLAAMRQSGADVQKTEHDCEIESVEQLGEALEGDDDIETLEDLAAAVGSGEEKRVDGEDTFSDSRRWRTGKFSLVRELRR